MPKTKNSSTKQSRNASHTGKKGGFGVLTPETIGAMAGAAIGGVAGMMLGNRHTKGKIATAKEGVVTATKSAAGVLESQAVSLQKEADQAADGLIGRKTTRKKKTAKK